VVLDLLKKGHPRAPDKLARGIRSIQARAENARIRIYVFS
jgi:hypothetical protein